MEYCEVGKVILKGTAGKKMTLRELARKAGVSAAYISEINRGTKIPSKRIADKICAELSLSKQERWALYDCVSMENGKIPYDVEKILMRLNYHFCGMLWTAMRNADFARWEIFAMKLEEEG